jgi:hypothetical protein
MKTTAIRTTIAVVVVALGVAAPAAHAAKNTGAFQHSGASRQVTCDNIFTLFSYDVEQAGNADKAGDTKSRNTHLDHATQDLHMAQQAGCDWA